MIAVIFELIPKQSRTDDYFKIASMLRTRLEAIDGFISVERFQSITDPGKYLSLSFWRDEEAVANWRNQAEHRDAQRQGRAQIFDHYRLRVAHVSRDYGLTERAETPTDSLNLF